MENLKTFKNKLLSTAILTRLSTIAIIIVVLMLLKFYVFTPIEHVDLTPDKHLIVKVDSLETVITCLQADVKYAESVIIYNNIKIDSLYKLKQLDSVTIANYTTDNQLVYFMNYLDTTSIVKLTNVTTLVNSGYIVNANIVFVEHTYMKRELAIVYDNLYELESINDIHVEMSNVSTNIGSVELTIKQQNIDKLLAVNKEYRKQIRKYKFAGIAGVAIIILIAL